MQETTVMENSEDFKKPLEKEQEIYKREKLLGTGSFGRAFLVTEIKTNASWVIKQINMVDMTPEEQENAMKEVKILQQLDHPNIVRFKEVYRTSKMKLNIVMEYANGGDLAMKIKEAKENNQTFEESQILNWFTQICLAVKCIHDRKIIHRDLKGQNIFLTSDNCVKIGDFGVARLLEHTLSKARTVVGSPYYLSPEIIQNKPYSSKTDIWSLGALLFEMCALVPPFTANNLQFLALKIVKGSYAQIPNKYSNELKVLIKSMLHTKENLRPNVDQILSSKIIKNRISQFIKESQEKQNVQANVFAEQSSKHFYTLKPPPNLLLNEVMENKSQVLVKEQMIEEHEEPLKIKAKTPQVATRKGANNFFNRPITAKKKAEENHELANLIQIKPSHLEVHEKHQKPILPKIPPKPSTHLNNGNIGAVVAIAKTELIKKNEPPMKQSFNMCAIMKGKTCRSNSIHLIFACGSMALM